MEHLLGSMLGGGKKIKHQKDWETAISATANTGSYESYAENTLGGADFVFVFRMLTFNDKLH